MLNVQQKDEVDALQKTLQSNKCALDAMKKTLDNEKAFRICADQEIKNLKEQIKFNTNKYKILENENEKLKNEKLKIEEAKSKISLQCNELIQKNISLESHCEKKELAYDEQTNTINQLENNITELKDKINSYLETEEDNNKLVKQIKSFSKQMETYENEREVYVQRLQKMQKEENELKCIVKDLKKEIDLKNHKICNLNAINLDLSSKNSIIFMNFKNLQTNFTNCLRLLDEIFEKYEKYQIKENKKIENNEVSEKLQPFLNETFELFDKTLTEYKLLKSSFKETEVVLKNEINKKDNVIKVLKDKINDYEQEKVKNDISNINPLETINMTGDLNYIQPQNESTKMNKLYLINELEKNLTYINQIKIEVLPKQKLIVSGCKEFMIEKIKEIDNLNLSKNTYIENILIKIIDLEKEIVNKNETLKALNTEVLKLKNLITEKDALCNEMEIELQHFRDNLGIY